MRLIAIGPRLLPETGESFNRSTIESSSRLKIRRAWIRFPFLSRLNDQPQNAACRLSRADTLSSQQARLALSLRLSSLLYAYRPKYRP